MIDEIAGPAATRVHGNDPEHLQFESALSTYSRARSPQHRRGGGRARQLGVTMLHRVSRYSTRLAGLAADLVIAERADRLAETGALREQIVALTREAAMLRKSVALAAASASVAVQRVAALAEAEIRPAIGTATEGGASSQYQTALAGLCAEFVLAGRRSKTTVRTINSATQVNTDLGPMWIADDDSVVRHHLIDHGSWEPHESALLEEWLKPGMVVVNVGAHVGYHVIRASRLVGENGRVIAVEADPFNHLLLNANLEAHQAENVLSIAAAALAHAGTADLSLADDQNTGDHRTYRRPDVTEVLRIPAITLDGILPSDVHIDAVVVDIQGSDHLAIQGMTQTIRRCRPRMMVEFWPPGIEELGDSPVEVLRFYSGLGYSLHMIEGDGYAPAARSPDEIIASTRSMPGEYSTIVLTPNGDRVMG